GRSAAGDGVPGVAGVVRAVLGGEPGEAEAAGEGGRQLSVCCGHFSHERGEAVADRESLVFREGGKIEQAAALYTRDFLVGNNLRFGRHPEGGHREAKQSNGTKTSVSELTSRSPVSSRLEEFDEITGRVLGEDLSTPGPGDDVIAEAYTFRFESSDLAVEFVGDEMDAIPPSGLRTGAARHRTSRGALRPAQKEAEVPAHDVGERGGTRVHHEAEMARVESHGGRHVVDNAADTDRAIGS